MRFASSIARVPVATVLAAVVAVLAFAASQPGATAWSAGSTSTVTYDVTTANTIGTCAPGPAIQFGTMLPGATKVPASDCTVTFGATNGTSMLRMYQSDATSTGNAMYAMTDGKLDTGWDGPGAPGNGVFQVPGFDPNPPTDYDTIPAMLQPTTGKVVSAVREGNGLTVMRFNENGTLDTSYGDSANGTIDIGLFPHASLGYPAMAPDGSTYFYDREQWGTPPLDNFILKLTPNGLLDPDFDGPTGTGNGAVMLPDYMTFTYLKNHFVTPDGDLIVVGTLLDSSYRGVVARFKPDGTPDTSFGSQATPGYRIYDVGCGPHTWWDSAVLQSDGKLVLAGHEWGGTQSVVAARLLPDGALDPSFDGPGTPGDGMFCIDLPTESSTSSSVALASDGDILIAGGRDPDDGGPLTADSFILRLQGSNGDYDTSWDGPTGTGNGRAIYQLSTNRDDALTSILVAPTGEIFAGGAINVNATVKGEPTLLKLDDQGRVDQRFDGDTGTANGIVQVPMTTNDEWITNMTFARNGDVVAAVFGDGPASDTMNVLRFKGASIPDYDDQGLPGDRDWTTGSGFLAVCLRSFTGTGAAVTAPWSTADPTCAQNDTGTTWQGIPKRTGSVKVGEIASTAIDGSATFQFALQVPIDQRAGKYVAPVTLEVVSTTA